LIPDSTFNRVPSIRTDALCLVLLAAVTLATYAPILTYDFVGYDDGMYVTENPHVQSGVTVQGVAWAFTTGYANNWHPLTWLSHMADCQLFGLRPWGHHLTSLLLHTLNALLLFSFLRRVTGERAKSLAVAALFALHPLHVESVAWVAERKDVLCGLFWMASLLAYAAYTRRGKRVAYLALVAFFCLGLLAKPMIVTLPFVLLLLDYWPLRRTGVKIASLIIEKIPLFLLSGMSCVVTFLVQQRGGSVMDFDRVPLPARLSNIPLAYVSYLVKTIYPHPLAVFYPHPGTNWAMGPVLAAIAILIAMTVLAVALKRRGPYLPVGWLWYLGTLVPVIGLVQVGEQGMADRYTYLPLIGVFVMLAWGVTDLLHSARYRKILLSILASGALLACVVITSFQLPHWKNVYTLFDHAIQAVPNNLQAHNALGRAYLKRQQYAEASEQFRAVVEIDPRHYGAMTRWATSLRALGKADEAIQLYQSALTINPEYVDAQMYLGMALCERGELEQGVAWLTKALAARPDDADIHYNLGVALARQGKNAEAAQHFAEALRCRPDDAAARRAFEQVQGHTR
jgi:protein O-mannosyl-transferase